MSSFRSPLGPKMEAFLVLHRASGRKYRAAEEELRRVDRFVAAMPVPSAEITPELAHAWLSAKPHLHPVSQRQRASVFRLFCVYLQRFDPQAYVPPRWVSPARLPERKPHVFSIEEMRILLRAALALSTRRWWLRPQMIYTLISLLYGTGLRIGEACRLTLADVDLADRVLHVRDTKFFKTRIVPFSKTVAAALSAYLRLRNSVASCDSSAPFFVNRLRRPPSVVKTSWLFHRMVCAAGIAVRGERTPRLHDLRRTFAVHRLIRWYRDGADIGVKLPLLATYLGHSTERGTDVYLTATTELLGEASGRFERRYGSLISEPEP